MWDTDGRSYSVLCDLYLIYMSHVAFSSCFVAMWLTYAFLSSGVNRDNSCYPCGSAFRRKRAMVYHAAAVVVTDSDGSGSGAIASPSAMPGFWKDCGLTNKPHPWDSSLHKRNRFRKNKLHTRTSIIFFPSIFFLFAPFLPLKPLWWTVAQALNPSRGSLASQNLASWHLPGTPQRYQHNSHCLLSSFHPRMDVLHFTNCVWTQGPSHPTVTSTE